MNRNLLFFIGVLDHSGTTPINRFILLLPVFFGMTIHVLAQPVITLQPQDQNLLQGETAMFTVEATGTPPLTYQWRDYRNPTTFTEIAGATQPTLILTNVQPTPNRFAVQVTDSTGSVRSRLARLSVTALHPPTFLRQPTNETVEIGGSVTLSVLVTGTEPIHYQWRHQESTLPNETNSSLILTNLQLPQAGSYQIMASNVSGTVTSQVASIFLYRTIHPPYDPGLNITRNGNHLILGWRGAGALQEAASLAGPWTEPATADNLFTVPATNQARYFRMRNRHPRTANIFLPSTYEPETALPLVLLLEGYTTTPEDAERRAQLLPLSESRRFLYSFPRGFTNNLGLTVWNGTDAGGDYFMQNVDDVGYLSSLIHESIKELNADPKRIYLIGNSNGGFMAYRMACDRSGLIAGIASWAGTTFKNEEDCRPTEPVNILHMHATTDQTILYGGGFFPNWPYPYPGAMENIQTWADYNGCTDLQSESTPSLDLRISVPGLDTIVSRYQNAPPGGDVELWSAQGGEHAFDPSPDFSPLILDWLLARPKP